VLERLEREPFTSPALAALRGRLLVEGTPATLQIRRLVRLVDRLDWARNLFFRPIAAALVWMPQFAIVIEKWRIRYGPHVAGWVAAIGEFEAMSSLACFAYERPDAVFPELADSSERFYDAERLTHPLIPPGEAVANDVKLGGDTRLWIVSGSNMSGKSTLLRAVGLSVVLGWAGAPVTAGRLRLSRLCLGASMRTSDSVIDHRSRFYAEISRLKDIVDLARSGQPLLFLLDELLSGTNSHDRRLGAQALLYGLVERDAIGLATTHDLALAEIAEQLTGRAVNVHFEDHLEGGEIRFDFRLRPGVVARGNALELMRAVGLDV
jgi:DNA mismatch repair ATPase MutS